MTAGPQISKPRYGAPCNGCGLCCKLEVCRAGLIALRQLGAEPVAPCILLVEMDGRYWCKLVLVEAKHINQLPDKKPRIAEGLAIGKGCTMDDDEEVPSGKMHTCSTCGKTGAWGKTWVWFGNIEQLDAAPDELLKFCSAECVESMRRVRRLPKFEGF